MSELGFLADLVSLRRLPDQIPESSWPEIVGLAHHHRLAPMLLWSLKQHGCEVTSNPAWKSLTEATRQAVVSYLLLKHSQREINISFQAANLPAVWLKGFALTHTVYPEPPLRPMSDLDVWVPENQRHDALRLAQGMGYQFVEVSNFLNIPREDPLAEKFDYHYKLMRGMGGNVSLEIHYQLIRKFLSEAQSNWFWKHTQTVTLADGTTFNILCPEAHLLHLAAHLILHHRPIDYDLRHFLDLHLLITNRNIDWEIVTDQAVALDWAYVVIRALTLTVEYFATPVPESVLGLLSAHYSNSQDAVHVIQSQERGHRWVQLQEYLGYLSLREKVRLGLKILFPNRSYMRQRYSIKPGWPTEPYYIYRWFDQGREVVWAAWTRFMARFR